ncbi:imm11 family protein [Allosphingosinicella deserti]|uniref:imm11 family protein n=1 Tax=Allosphingosinicella deserti TaxID=2116704 RepID=UPI0011B21909|nr:DUF1629 domain-containing protein [Sphingomonas deserti]
MVVTMVMLGSELTIREMFKGAPEGQVSTFGMTIPDSGEESYYRVRQSFDYRPARLDWANRPSREASPWNGSRTTTRIPVAILPIPDVRFKGFSKDVVDFYHPDQDVFFISDALFRQIEQVDPASLEHVEFYVQAKDAKLPFHAVMPRRVIEAVDPRRTRVVIKDTSYGFRVVKFPDGVVFKSNNLQGVASFSDIDAGGWYWSKDLVDIVQSRGVRGCYLQSVASVPPREVARL